MIPVWADTVCAGIFFYPRAVTNISGKTPYPNSGENLKTVFSPHYRKGAQYMYRPDNEVPNQAKNVEAMKKAIRVNQGHMTEEQLDRARTQLKLGVAPNEMSQLVDRMASDSFQG